MRSIGCWAFGRWAKGLAIGAATATVLAGCSSPLFVTPSTGLSTLEAVSLMGTDKTLGDHVLSLYSGKDCSTLRTENDQTYCKEDEPVPQKTGYCYRSLGSITCYDRPDPYKGGYQEVEQKTEPLIKRH